MSSQAGFGPRAVVWRPLLQSNNFLQQQWASPLAVPLNETNKLNTKQRLVRKVMSTIAYNP